MELKESHTVEIRYSFYGDDINIPDELKCIERIVTMDGKEVYRDKISKEIYSVDNSPLSQLERWITGEIPPIRQF